MEVVQYQKENGVVFPLTKEFTPCGRLQGSWIDASIVSYYLSDIEAHARLRGRELRL